MLTHSQRVAKVKAYTEKNKLFSVIVVAIIFFLMGSFVTNKISDYKEKDTAAVSASSETEDNSVDTNINQEHEKEELHWRFYWTDVWVLVGGSGFCVYKILQEKKKAREKL
ncbi:MAG: hypothetical protein K5979_06360 [Ruminococcus sp.]|nr:hypothetical protein [Ruminococcus sp.]